jgi:hypothetical protein
MYIRLDFSREVAENLVIRDECSVPYLRGV